MTYWYAGLEQEGKHPALFRFEKESWWDDAVEENEAMYRVDAPYIKKMHGEAVLHMRIEKDLRE